MDHNPVPNVEEANGLGARSASLQETCDLNKEGERGMHQNMFHRVCLRVELGSVQFERFVTPGGKGQKSKWLRPQEFEIWPIEIEQKSGFLTFSLPKQLRRESAQ